MKHIPVYMFTGFLESGKTTFIKKRLKDNTFIKNELVLLLACEDGFVEYENYENVRIETMYDTDQISKEHLESINANYDMILIEANGMEKTEKLISIFPDNWVLFQQIMFIDSKTFVNYNMMFRELMKDKIVGSEMIVFNRVNEKMDKMVFHNSVRMFSRLKSIYYEHIDGRIEKDEIIEPLPYNLEQEVIEVAFNDYAIFYQNLNEENTKYFNKKIKSKLQFRSIESSKYLGRRVMICCEADIKFLGIYISNYESFSLRDSKWYEIEGIIRNNEDCGAINQIAIELINIVESDCPNTDEEVATFFNN